MLQNFVGLSVSDGYIATGSETNEVCISCASTSSVLLIDTIHMLVVGIFTPCPDGQYGLVRFRSYEGIHMGIQDGG